MADQYGYTCAQAGHDDAFQPMCPDCIAALRHENAALRESLPQSSWKDGPLAYYKPLRTILPKEWVDTMREREGRVVAALKREVAALQEREERVAVAFAQWAEDRAGREQYPMWKHDPYRCIADAFAAFRKSDAYPK